MAESETEMGFKPNRCYNLCYNMDCMEGMAQFQDGFFDLAVELIRHISAARNAGATMAPR